MVVKGFSSDGTKIHSFICLKKEDMLKNLLKILHYVCLFKSFREDWKTKANSRRHQVGIFWSCSGNLEFLLSNYRELPEGQKGSDVYNSFNTQRLKFIMKSLNNKRILNLISIWALKQNDFTLHCYDVNHTFIVKMVISHKQHIKFGHGKYCFSIIIIVLIEFQYL